MKHATKTSLSKPQTMVMKYIKITSIIAGIIYAIGIPMAAINFFVNSEKLSDAETFSTSLISFAHLFLLFFFSRKYLNGEKNEKLLSYSIFADVGAFIISLVFGIISKDFSYTALSLPLKLVYLIALVIIAVFLLKKNNNIKIYKILSMIYFIGALAFNIVFTVNMDSSSGAFNVIFGIFVVIFSILIPIGYVMYFYIVKK